MGKFTIPAVLALGFALSACVTPDYQHTATGATLGGITGAVIGHQLDDNDGRYVGGALGALVGAAIGDGFDNAYSRGYGYSDQRSDDNYQYRHHYDERYSGPDYRYQRRRYGYRYRGDRYHGDRYHGDRYDRYAPYPPSYRDYRRY